MPRSIQSRILPIFCGGVLLSTVFHCGPSQLTVFDDDPHDPTVDGSTMPPDPRPDLADRPPQMCGTGGVCPEGKVCFKDRCIPDRGACCSDDDCQNDTHCTTQSAPATFWALCPL